MTNLHCEYATDGARRAVVCDIDTILYDEEKFYAGLFAKVSRWVAQQQRRDANELERGLWALAAHVPLAHPRLMELFCKSCALPEHLHGELLDMMRHHEPELELDDDSVFFLENRPSEVVLGIISDGDGFVERNKVRLLQIAREFDPIILTADFGSGWVKPSTLPLRAACSRWGLDPSDVTYVGHDPRVDSVGPARLGMRTVRLLRGPYREKPTDPAHPFDIEVRSLSELLKSGFLSAQGVSM